MMPDLGKYAAEVLLAYGAAVVLIGGLVALSSRSAIRAKAHLHEAERTDPGRRVTAFSSKTDAAADPQRT